jgi:hypothetical protein
MRTFALLFLGVVVGWAAGGVDWSRDAVGQDTDSITGKPVLQFDGVAPLAQGRTIVLDEVVDEHGGKHVVPHERVDSPLCESGRYQISAWGGHGGNGCYIVDSSTGAVWHADNGNKPKLISDKFLEK